MSKLISILSTAEVGNGAKEQAQGNGVAVDIVPFIDVRYIVEDRLAEKVKMLSKNEVVVVFTSKHAVLALAQMLDCKEANWLIYCLGNKTKIIVNQYFSKNKIVSVSGDAQELAEKLIEDRVKDIIFFCGDKRMDTLPDMMKNAGVNVQEYIVYHTINRPHLIQRKYDGILFYSPSGVDSFFSVNEAAKDIVFFSIGGTTADAIRKYTDNEIIISSIPTKEHVLLDAVKYFKTTK